MEDSMNLDSPTHEPADRPEPPLPVSKHYAITHTADLGIQAELERIAYAGNMVGLGVVYRYNGSDTGYSIEFGKVRVDDTGGDYPLEMAYVVDLYREVRNFIVKNTPPQLGTPEVELTITLNRNEMMLVAKCRQVAAGECDQIHSGLFKICSSWNNRRTWRCSHNDC
jgi:hypothetical protein